MSLPVCRGGQAALLIAAERGALCRADGWAGLVGIEAPADAPRGGNEIGGVLAVAMGIGEVFRSAVLGGKLACRRTSRNSASSPGYEDGDDVDLAYLPAAFWLLGLGNLGQATLWTIGLLPYSDPGLVSLFLEDGDKSEFGNLAIQVLTKPNWIGRKKARSAGFWAEERGFGTTIIESRLARARSARRTSLAWPSSESIVWRRGAAAGSNFDLVVDAGLGATPSEIFDIRIHGFPGTRSPKQAWPEPRLPTGNASRPARSGARRCWSHRPIRR
ncbi:hypothetical protein BRAS3843_2560026 [Bradyrhizobium sp. STM 3843]|uniref:hypothetical protein n=1 Tax=Bradyrhizobium sp. STM 3843 TaxID=551947 RepID=UPI0002404C6D|nr:hypothetical protein [Bradyrhizobium sp. STM 3843]CCE08077.1 hypothetical protein BRAS3843_2560026 [Bradyrhizobium sp. STM 3843]